MTEPCAIIDPPRTDEYKSTNTLLIAVPAAVCCLVGHAHTSSLLGRALKLLPLHRKQQCLYVDVHERLVQQFGNLTPHQLQEEEKYHVVIHEPDAGK